jgi:hypothetical protein
MPSDHAACREMVRLQDELLEIRDTMIGHLEQELTLKNAALALSLSIQEDQKQMIEAYKQMVALLLLVVAMMGRK